MTPEEAAALNAAYSEYRRRYAADFDALHPSPLVALRPEPGTIPETDDEAG